MNKMFLNCNLKLQRDGVTQAVIQPAVLNFLAVTFPRPENLTTQLCNVLNRIDSINNRTKITSSNSTKKVPT